MPQVNILNYNHVHLKIFSYCSSLYSLIVIEVILQVFLLVFLKDDNNKRKLHKQYNTIIAISPLLEIYFASQQPSLHILHS